MTTSVPKRAPSIRDVAALAGVSHQTVSRVLNGHPSIRDSTKQRVVDAMEALHYRPNRAARTLVTKKSRTIGVLSASNTQYGPQSSLASIELAARARGYFVNTVTLESLEKAAVDRAIDHLLDQAVEGLVVVAPQRAVLDALAGLHFDLPFVTLQSAGHTEAAGLSVDQISGARLATRHLLELGHRNIVHIAGPSGWIEAEARQLGYEQELAAWGVPAQRVVVGDWSARSGYELATAFLDGAGGLGGLAAVGVGGASGVTAVFSANDQMALGVAHAAFERGIRIPGQLSLVGFDDIPESAYFSPGLTTIRQDFSELGRRCVDLLLGMTDSEPAPTAQTLEPALVLRASTAAPA